MVCRHQLMVFHERGVQRVPHKYVFRRWRKDVKRVHTKVRIKYDNSSSTIEARQHDNMCNLFDEVADLAEDSQEKYDKVMTRLLELKRELIESSNVCGSNMTSGTPNNSFSIGDEILSSKETTNILDPVQLRRKGRPPTKRKQGFIEKVGKKKIETQKKILSKEKAKSYPSYIGQLMWPNMMSRNMRPNMAQGGSVLPAQGESVLPFSPSLCPTRTGFNQFINNFSSSQSNMPSFTGTQVWGRGQSTFLGDQGQDWGGAQPNFTESQGQGGGGAHQSFTEMIFARHYGEE
ncbi:hypothetical protein RHMOL_Rhmol11G0056600 [Rhododendron molle]|uniref:Uncharacterized protein n=1 Tax=Rhododendron molle TaxID=49168 RepID=A0ACC0LPU3_RHOML|nr:hypothetical protein RHMOL_Rhmol11G0056600 [Rhododendron molle]